MPTRSQLPPSRGSWLRIVNACVFLAMLLVVAHPVAAALPTGLSTGLTLEHDALVRTYDVLYPVSASTGPPRPLVLDLHGFTSDAAQQRLISGWQGIAGTDSIIVAWPNGTDNSWNAGTCCGAAVTNGIDDVGFLRALVIELITEANVDPDRVYVTGLSNGGAMTHRLACEAADVFAAAAPMAFPVPYTNFAVECQPSESVPLLLFMGLTDTLVSYAGAAPSFAGWRDKLGCDSAGPPPEILEIYGGSDCEIDTSCAVPGHETGLCSVTGSDLDPPFDAFDGHILYINDDAFAISARALAFMERYSKGATGGMPVPVLAVPAVLAGVLGIVGGCALARRG